MSDSKKFPPGYYVVTPDPAGGLHLGSGLRGRVLSYTPDPPPPADSLADAVADWLSAPINEHGTPYVSHPLDFTPAEQSAFVDLVRAPRLVPREEQLAKLREIIAARKGTR